MIGGIFNGIIYILLTLCISFCVFMFLLVVLETEGLENKTLRILLAATITISIIAKYNSLLQGGFLR